MKKAVALLSLSVFICSSVWAASPDEERRQHRQDMKKVKQEMREKHEASPKSEKIPSKMDLFWKKEGERSGLGGTSGRVGSFLRNLNPMPFFKNQQEQYNARKTAGTIK